MSPNVTSWGGLPTKVNGTWHLHVAEMVNGCGLSTWTTNSRIVHAVSDSLFGVYQRKDVALNAFAHNPQLAVDHSGANPKYLLFHIGSGNLPYDKQKHCGTVTPPAPPANTTSNVLHVADSPYGPWTAVNDLPGINNPSPFVFPNGSIMLTGTDWKIWRAPSWKGPWTSTAINFTGDGGKGTWEDPYLWYDAGRKVYKLLSHVWPSYAPDQPRCDHDYSLREGGYAVSHDGVNFVKLTTQPFTNVVTHVDGTVTHLSTRERPKLVFADDGYTPIALANGVSSNPEPWGCKDKSGVDWTHTLVQPIGKQ